MVVKEVAAAEDALIKLIDFGLARKFAPGEKLASLVYTPHYVAPEVLARSYTEKCDVWSAGVVCYEMLTGRPLLQTFIGAGATGSPTSVSDLS